MKTKTFHPILLIFSLVACTQTQQKTPAIIQPGILHFNEVGWTIKIPEGSAMLTSAQVDSINMETARKMKIKLNDADLQNNQTLFSIKKDTSQFSATIEKYSTAQYPDWNQLHDEDKALIIKQLSAQKANMEFIDSLSSTETVDGLSFTLFYFKLYFPKQKMTMDNYWYARNINNYNFCVNIAFMRKDAGEKYLSIFKNSKFDK